MSIQFGSVEDTRREAGRPLAERWGGIVEAGAGRGRAPARFAWLDEVSGERLLVEVQGSEEFFRELEALGFERLG